MIDGGSSAPPDPPLAQEDKPADQPKAPQAQDNKAYAAPPGKWRLLIERGEEKDKTDWSKPKCDQPKSHDEADLCEQRRMSDAAKDAVWLNKIQTVLGGVGALLLLATLFYTIRQLYIAKNTAHRQLRAYLGIEYAQVLPPPDNYAFDARLVFKNFGQTPTYKVTVRYRVRTVGMAILDTFDAGLDGTKETPPATLGVGATMQVRIETFFGDDERTWMANGEAITVVIGDVRYIDIYGELWTETFRLREYTRANGERHLAP